MIFDVHPVRHSSGISWPDLYETHTLSDQRLELTVLTHNDAADFFDLYCHTQEKAIKSGEDAEQFAVRIAASCEMIWTIRLCCYPHSIIGDCALHDWDKDTEEIAFGGSLIPKYWGQGIMAAAFHLVATFAGEFYQVKSIKCTTSPANRQARRFAEKLGFKQCGITADTVLLKKKLDIEEDLNLK